MPGFDNLLIVVAVAFAAPLLLGFFPSVKLPSVVLEIIAGIVIGPSVLGIVHADEAISVVALLGLSFLLFLAGLEIEFDKLRGQVLRLTLMGFAISFAIAVVVALGLKASGLIETPLLIAIILCATSLGVLIPVLKDAGEISSTFGQLVVAAGTIADFGSVILLSIFFSGEGGVGSTLLLIGSLVLLAGVVLIAVKAPSAPGCCAWTWSDCRTRPPRSGSAGRWCCWSASRRSPTPWASSRSLAPSSRVQSSPSSTRTRR